MSNTTRKKLFRCFTVMILSPALNILSLSGAFAQDTDGKDSVSGTVTDDQGPVIGATVMLKDGLEGVSTGLDGEYRLTGLKPGDTIVFTILGYETREIIWNGQSRLDVRLEQSTEFLDEVVVTALGIKREAKALSYNVQQVNSEQVTAVKDANFVNSLVGKVAGVTINSGSGGPGSSARVVMRGTKSIEKDNNVLYVIDGIPMYNSNLDNGNSTFGGNVSSDSASDINPEDIESISMLTGPSAAALYGSSAANGVIMITTRRGTEGKTSVTLSNSTTFSTPYMMPEMQSRYGSSSNYQSWGSPVSSSYNPREFFNTGTNIISSFSLSTGNEKNQTYLSASSTNSDGIVPESSYDRYNVTARNTTRFAKDKLILDLGANLIVQSDHNLVSQGQYYNPLPALYLFPRGEDFSEVQLYERMDPVNGVMTQYWPYSSALSMQNPYWIQKRNNRDTGKRRFMLNASLQYNITDWLNVTARARLDESHYRRTREYYATTLTTFCGDNGGFSLDEMMDKTFYSDIIANIDKRWGDWRLVANIGASVNDQMYESSSTAGDLKVANQFYTSNLNTSQNFKTYQSGWHDQTQSVFGSVELGWRDMIFLTLTGRNDWASQLAFTSNSSFFYPSAGLSAVISEMVQLPEWFSYLKVRGSYAEVASAFERYLSNPSYTYNEQTHTWSKPTTYPAYDLQPENTVSWEAGITMNFLKSINLDVTYYRSNTYNQTIYAPLSSSTGYSQFVAQSGNVQNQGVELTLGYQNRWGDFDWSSNFTYSFNKNKIIELAHGIPDPVTGTPVDVTEIEQDFLGQSNVAPRVILKEGGSMSDVYVNHFLARDLNGNILVDENGNISMEETEYVKVGQLSPKANLGWSNTFGYKGLSLGIVISARIGGLVYSATQGILDYYGVSEASAAARDNGGVAVNYGTIGAQQYFQTIATADGGYGAYYLYDATNVRIQELALNYTFPKRWFNNRMGMTIGVVAKNLAMLYCKAPFDPEISASTTSNYYQGVDYFMLPSTRNFGFNIKLQF